MEQAHNLIGQAMIEGQSASAGNPADTSTSGYLDSSTSQQSEQGQTAEIELQPSDTNTSQDFERPDDDGHTASMTL